MTILIAILIFGALILIHECGHYITARIFHVQINEFAIGMGPCLLSRVSRKTGIRYSLRALPFGGFVSMLGELGEEEEEPRGGTSKKPFFGYDSVPPVNEESEVKADEPYLINRGNTLASRPGWQRLIVHAAGGVMNILLALVLLIALAIATPLGSTVVAEFVDLSNKGYTTSTEDCGLSVGDEILSVAGQRVYISDQLLYQITRYGHTGEPIEVVVRHRDGTRETLSVLFPTFEAEGQIFGDIDFKVFREEKNLGTVLKQAFFKSVYLVEMIWESIFDLITGRYTVDAVAGPVGTAGAISSAAKSGASTLFYLTAIISMNLGIFNLLPVPLLDGGHIAYTAIEMVTRRRLPKKVIGILEAGFAVLLFGFMIFITFQDITKLF